MKEINEEQALIEEVIQFIDLLKVQLVPELEQINYAKDLMACLGSLTLKNVPIVALFA